MDDQGAGWYQVRSEGQSYGQVVGENNQVVQNFHLPFERNRQDVEARRRQFCVPILTSIHELAPPLAKLREVHDNLWERPKFFLQGWKYAKEANALSKKAHERFALAGSELSIDPEGQKVMDAMVECLKAKDEYVQAMLHPLRKVHTHFFGKTDAKVLDELAKRGDDKLTVLEEAIRLYVNQI